MNTASQTKIAMIFLILGIFLVLFNSVILYRAILWPKAMERQIKLWQVVPAVIIKSDINHTVTNRVSSYTPDIHYTYRFNGKDYVSDRYYFGITGGTQAWAESIQRQHPPGTQTNAWVYPQHPEEAVLNPQIALNRAILALSIIGIVIGSAMILGGLASGRNASKPRCFNDLRT